MTPRVGSILQIEAVSCRFEADGHAIAGTTHVVVCEEADGWEPEDEEVALRFVGYMVTMDVEEPPD